MRAILLAIVLVPSLARADQCAIVDADTAEAAVGLVRDRATVSYCEPCGDKKPNASTARTRSARVVSSGHDARVAIDGTEVDLAYTFVKTGKSTWTNLALMVGCEAEGVSAFVTLKPVAPPPPPPPRPANKQQPCDPFTHMHGC